MMLKLINIHLRKYSTKSLPKKGQNNKKKWQSVIGLEVHAQILRKTKLFSGASTEFASPVNTNVTLFDAAIPGTLPVLNRKCVESAVLTALALNCHINAVSMFDRKHYFYADLPAGYQITQQRSPLANNGQLKFEVYTPGIHKTPYSKVSRLKQLQLEQDSGKSLHDDENQQSLVDLNRAGVGLMELVFEPDLSDGEEAAALVKELSIILQRLGTCSCKMEEGALRVDANISINKPGEPLGTRSEVKNIGSIRGVSAAVNYEIQRQIAILEDGGRVINETRAWNAISKTTVAMRDKEVVQDYRFMPEPNLPPLHLIVDKQLNFDKNLIDVTKIKSKLPELPEETRDILKTKYHLTSEQAIILVNEDLLLNYFKTIAVDDRKDSKMVANVLINEILTLVNKYKLNITDLQSRISAGQVGELVELMQSKTINLLIARKVLDKIINGDKNSPLKIVELNGWAQITDTKEITKICRTVLEDNPKLVTQYLGGKKKVFSALLGIVANQTQQRVNMEEVNKILKVLLAEKQ